MGLFDQFPYTNFHELNLMWILEALKEIQTTTEQFVAINSLKYADPIQWNIVKQYEKNTIVIDPLTGTAYISVQPVPTGVALTNEDYWTVVFNLREFVVRAAKNFTTRFEEDTTLTATFNTAAGQWVVWGDTLYRANVNITAGDSYVVDGNITRITVEEIKDEIYTYFDGKIGDLTNLSTTDKDNIVAAINEIVSTISQAVSDLQDAITSEATARADADTALQTAINNEATARADADTALQTAINNEATARADAINAEATARAQADNTINAEIDTLTARIDNLNVGNWLDNKRMLIFGDSLLTTRERPTIQTYLETKVPSLTITNYSVSGLNMQAIAASIAEHTADIANADIVFFNGGTNDWQESKATLTYKTSLISAINSIISANPTCRIIFMTSPYSVNPGMTSGIYNNIGATLEVYNAVSIATCKAYGISIVDAYHCTPCNSDTYTSLMVDDVTGYYVHPSSVLCDYITDLILNESFSNDNPSIMAHTITSSYGGVQAPSFVEFDPNNGIYHGSINLNLSTDISASNTQVINWKMGGTMQAFAPQNIGFRGIGVDYNTGSYFTFNVVNELITIEKIPGGTLPANHILTFNF